MEDKTPMPTGIDERNEDWWWQWIYVPSDEIEDPWEND